MSKPINLHIVSFSIPFPANFGGVIDVFYKLQALKNANVNIYLHCFQYDRKPTTELDRFCVSVKYYLRNVGFSSTLHVKPYIVFSRSSSSLMDDLLKDNYPIIFEGLHSCFFLNDKRLKNRLKIYRESNIEHEYYYHLAKSTDSLRKKIFYYLESLKLRLYQKQLKYADYLLVVSQKDCDYLSMKFPDKRVIYLPSFHGNDRVLSEKGRGEYVLYHGNLSVEENVIAALYIINNFSETGIPLIIAGLNPDKTILAAAKTHPNVTIIDSPNDDDIHRLIAGAQINLLYTAQATGLKLKLLNVLFRGRFVLVNSKMCRGTNLSELCEIADSTNQMIDKLKLLFVRDFTQEEIDKRTATLSKLYSDSVNAQTIIKLLNDR